MMTVLTKCGLSNKIVQELKEQGLYVPGKQEPFRQAMKSPSEDWLVYSLDEFTPPLTEEERVRYIEQPEVFCQDLLENLGLFSYVCSILYDALPCIKNLPPPEAVASYLAVIRIFQAAMDYHYYKYDRHIEFHEYEASPVGFHWNRLLHSCLKAAQRAGIDNPQAWSREYALTILSQVGHGNMAIQFLLSCLRILTELKKIVPDLSEFTPDRILEFLEQEDKVLYERLVAEAGKFRRSPIIFINHCLKLNDSRALERLSSIESSTKESKFEDITKHLLPEEVADFNRSVRAMGLFQAVQEEETYRFYGLMPRHNAQNLEVGFASWSEMTKILENNPELIGSEHRQAVFEMFQGNPIVGTRRLLYEGEYYFDKAIEEQYFKELDRWITYP